MGKHETQKSGAGGRPRWHEPVNDQVKYWTQQMNRIAIKGDADECEILLVRMISSNLQPTSITFNVLLKAYCTSSLLMFNKDSSLDVGSSDVVLKALTLLQALDPRPSSTILLPKMPFLCGNFLMVIQCANYVRADEGTYNILISLLSKQNQFSLAHLLLKRQKESGFRTNKSLSSCLRLMSAKRISLLVHELLSDENEELSFGLRLNDFEIDITIVNTLLKVLLSDIGKTLNVDLGRKLLQFSKQERNIQPDNRTFSIIFSRSAADGDSYFPHQLLKNELQTNPRFHPDLILLTSYINCLVSTTPPQMNEAEKIVYMMEQTSSSPKHITDISYDEETTEFLTLLQRSLVPNTVPDIMLYNLLIKGYTRITPPRHLKARQVMDNVAKIGLKPSIVTVASVVNAYCSVGLPREAEEMVGNIVQRDHSLKASQNATLYNTLIKGFARCRCQVLYQRCGCVVCYCSNPDEALRLVHSMENKGLAPDEITLNTVIDSLCSSERFEEAKNVIDSVMRAVDSKIPPSISTYTVLLRGMSRHIRGLPCSHDVPTEASEWVDGEAIMKKKISSEEHTKLLQLARSAFREVTVSFGSLNKFTKALLVRVFTDLHSLQDIEEILNNPAIMAIGPHAASTLNATIVGLATGEWQDENKKVCDILELCLRKFEEFKCKIDKRGLVCLASNRTIYSVESLNLILALIKSDSWATQSTPLQNFQETQPASEASSTDRTDENLLHYLVVGCLASLDHRSALSVVDTFKEQGIDLLPKTKLLLMEQRENILR